MALTQEQHKAMEKALYAVADLKPTEAVEAMKFALAELEEAKAAYEHALRG